MINGKTQTVVTLEQLAALQNQVAQLQAANNALIKVPVRYFVIMDNEVGELDHVEVSEGEFLEHEGSISYERHTIFNNGVSQICLTKSEYH